MGFLPLPGSVGAGGLASTAEDTGTALELAPLAQNTTPERADGREHARAVQRARSRSEQSSAVVIET